MAPVRSAQRAVMLNEAMEASRTIDSLIQSANHSLYAINVFHSLNSFLPIGSLAGALNQ